MKTVTAATIRILALFTLFATSTYAQRSVEEVKSDHGNAHQLNVEVNLPPTLPADISAWRSAPTILAHVRVVNMDRRTRYDAVRVEATVTNLSTGRVVSRSGSDGSDLLRVTIPEGPFTLHCNGASLVGVTSALASPSLSKGATLAATSKPTVLARGRYRLTVRLLDNNNQLIAPGAEGSGIFSVDPQEPPQLESPKDSTEIPPSALPLFTWAPATPVAPPPIYRLRIVPIYPSQTKEAAIETNAPLVTRYVTGTSYQYSPLDPPFILFASAPAFAWRVERIEPDQEGTEENYTPSDIRILLWEKPAGDGDGRIPNGLVHCRCQGFSLLIPESICKALGGDTTDAQLEETEEGRENPLAFRVRWVAPPLMIPRGTPSVMLHAELPTPDLAVMSFRRVGDVTDQAMYGEVAIDGTEVQLQWGTGDIALGVYEVTITASNGAGQTASDYFYTEVTNAPLPIAITKAGSPPTSGSGILTTITTGEIEDAARCARQAGARAEEARRRRDSLIRAQSNANDAYDSTRRLARQLERIDGVLDHVPDAYRPEIDDLLKKLDSIRNGLGGKVDTAELQRNVDDAKARLDDCHKRQADLDAEQKKLEAERDALLADQNALLAQLNTLFNANGMTGSSGFHADGTVHWGYVGVRPGSQLPPYSEYGPLYNKIKAANRRYKAVLARLNQLPNIRNNANDDCDKLAAALKAAEDAKANGDAYAAGEVDMKEICRQIASMVEQLKAWCQNHPDLCDFRAKIDDLLRDCPDDSASWNDFWRNYGSMLERKQAREKELKGRADSLDRAIDSLGAEIDSAGVDIEKEKEKEDEEWRRVDNLRRQQERDLADARARAEAAERERQRDASVRANDCFDSFAQWIAQNQQYVSQSDLDALSNVADAARAVAEAGGEFTRHWMNGARPSTAGLSALGQGIFSLGVSIFYSWAGSAAEGAVKRIGDRWVLRIIQAQLINDNRECGVIRTTGLDGKPSPTSFFFFRRGNKLLVFRISATHGFECLGEI